VLPYVDDKVLMQLRDEKVGIAFPGHWGFFGGAIDEGEQPKETALRELKEELDFQPDDLHWLETVALSEFDDQVIHSFFCPLTVPVERLILKEGMDSGLFTLQEVLAKKLYSKKMKRTFPIVDSEFIGRAISNTFRAKSELLRGHNE